MEIISVPETKQMLWWRQWEEPRRFYTKYLDVEGIAIIGSDGVGNNTFHRAKDIILKVTSKHLQFRRDLSGIRLMLAARGTWIQNLPELREYRGSPFGCSNISTERVGFCASVVEWDSRPNMGVLTHELGHAIVPSISRIEPNFENLLNQAYGSAAESGVWGNEWFFSQGTWEYWAEGVRMWTHDVGTDRRFETKEAFIEHDRSLAELLDNWLHVGDIPYEY